MNKLHKQKNMGEIKAKTNLQNMGFLEKDKKNSKHDIIQQWAYENAKEIISKTIMSKNEFPFKIINNIWEYQLQHNKGNFKSIVGFIDLYVKIKGTFLSKYENENYEGTKDIFIEVKTQIPNLGELIRQMRTYQTFKGYDTYYLIVSPDDRFEKILNEQGFWFYKYKDPNLLF